MKRTFGAAALSVTLASLFAAAPAKASEEDFFKGKNVTIYIGFSPGGTYDLFGRMVGRFIGKHIPGNPTVVASNMPGVPGKILGLPASRCKSGSQPISRSAPVASNSCALRARASSEGRACTRCGSCKALVATYTLTLSAPSSSANAPHSGTVAKTLSCAWAPTAVNANDRATAARPSARHVL